MFAPVLNFRYRNIGYVVVHLCFVPCHTPALPTTFRSVAVCDGLLSTFFYDRRLDICGMAPNLITLLRCLWVAGSGGNASSELFGYIHRFVAPPPACLPPPFPTPHLPHSCFCLLSLEWQLQGACDHDIAESAFISHIT